MQYRQLPNGNKDEKFSVLGLGMDGIQHTPADEIEAIINKAIENGINFFDLCAGGAVYEPLGKAMKGKREKIFLQVHFGAVYDENGEYCRCRDLETIKNTFWWELERLATDYVDFGFLHCVDEDEDFDKLVEIGVLDYLKELKSQGVVRHIGFSSHTPSVANRIIDTGLVDMMMLSINPACDCEKGDEYGIGTVNERFKLFKRCESEGIGISVMKPLFAGQLIGDEHLPFGESLTDYQCLQNALDYPGVLTVVPGVQTMEHLDTLLGFVNASSPVITLDKATAMAFCGDDEEFYVELFKEFTLLPIREELTECLKAHDYKSYCIRVHGFKNTSYTMGAKELGDMAYELERLACGDMTEKVLAQIEVLQKKMFDLYDIVCSMNVRM